MNMARRNAWGENAALTFESVWPSLDDISGGSQTNADRRSGMSRDNHASRIMLLP
jgi:hypothetical protein